MSRTYGYYLGQTYALDTIEKKYPSLKNQVFLAKNEFDLKYSKSLKEIELDFSKNMTKEQLARGLSIINETAAIKYSYQVVDDYLTKARNVLPSCLDTEVKEAFNSVADFVQMRDF